MKILGIEHIGIAVTTNNDKFWKIVLGIKHTKKESVKNQGVITDIYDTKKGKIELLQSLYPGSVIDKFIKKRGPGIHHICFEVESIRDAVTVLKKEKVKLIDEIPRMGAEKYKIVFIHPDSTGGVLVELAEKTI